MDAGLATDGNAAPVDANSSTDAGSSTDAASSDAAVDARAPVDAGAASDAGPITGTTAETWTWVPVSDAHCRDGSSTGIGVNINPNSTNLMIFLEGGGACFNPLTCLQNAPSFGASDFATFASGKGGEGIFSRTDAANSVKDWSMVYVPYCTGDVHSGNNPNGSIAGVTSGTEFVGYKNIGIYLNRIVPTFTTTTHVLLTGVSAGGFGAATNLDQVAAAFPSTTQIDLIDDSGPFMEPPYLTSCLQEAWASTWGFDTTVFAACGADCPDHTNFALDFAKHVVTKHPNTPFGLMDSTDDGTISVFFGFGYETCSSFQQLSATQFTAGLDDIRTQLAGSTNFGAFLFTGADHTSLESAYDTRVAGTTKLTDWVTAVVGGTVTNVGP